MLRSVPDETPNNLIKRLGQWWNVTQWDESSSEPLTSEKRERVFNIDKANVVGSQRSSTGEHAVLLDLDIPAYLVPSSTPGHSHLYIDVRIPERKYFMLLDLLADCEVIEEGYADASRKRGMSFLRLPWVKKDESTKEVGPERIKREDQ